MTMKDHEGPGRTRKDHEVGGAVVECPKKLFPLILMKLWDLIVIGIVNMCTKFQQEKLPGSASSTCKSGFEKVY